MSGTLQNSGVIWSAELECNPHGECGVLGKDGVQNSTPVCCTPFGHILTMNNCIHHNQYHFPTLLYKFITIFIITMLIWVSYFVIIFLFLALSFFQNKILDWNVEWSVDCTPKILLEWPVDCTPKIVMDWSVDCIPKVPEWAMHWYTCLLFTCSLFSCSTEV